MAERAPLLFTARLGMLKPANRIAQDALHELRGTVEVTIKGGKPNQKRRALYWVCAGIVAELLNEAHGLTLDEQDLHDVTRMKLRLYDEITLPSGDVHRKLKGTNNRAMNEAERAEYTTRALTLWSTWTGVAVTALRTEAERMAA